MALRNALRPFAMLALAAALGCGLIGCAPAPEEAIRASLSEKLDDIKGLDEGFLRELQADMDIDRFGEYGIDGLEFMKAYLEGFDYSIDSVEVADGTATATVTLQCKSFSQYRDQLTAAAKELVGDRSKLASMSNDEVNAAYGALITQTLENVENAPTSSFTITFSITKKPKGGWRDGSAVKSADCSSEGREFGSPATT